MTLADLISEVYVDFDVPSDQIVQNPGTLEAFSTRLRDRVLEEFVPENVARELVNQRKAGRLPRIRQGIK